jgi:hypothetical protein
MNSIRPKIRTPTAMVMALLVIASTSCGQEFDKARNAEIEYRIPTNSARFFPEEMGSTGAGYIERGPTRDDQRRKEGAFVIFTDSILTVEEPSDYFLYVTFADKNLPLAAWELDVPKRGLQTKWSEWRRPTFVDGSEDPSWKLLSRNSASRRDTPQEMVIEMRFRVPTYFQP